MRAIGHILLDSIRFLRSSSLFWIALGLSALTSIILFGLIDFQPDGWRVLWFSTNESDTLVEGSEAARGLVSWLFGGALMWWWLTWIAILVALISTASVMPEFLSSGAIDLMLARPMSRAKLFLTKFTGSLLFMFAQALLAVSVGYILCGLRFGMWFHEAWLAVPLVAIQFLYLYAVMTLAAMITRSTLASLLITLLFWGAVSVVQFASNQFDAFTAQTETQMERVQNRADTLRAAAAAEARDLSTSEANRVEMWDEEAADQRSTLETFEPWARRVALIELVVPKTGDIQKIIAERMNAPTFGELLFILQGGSSEMFAQMSGVQDPQLAEDMQVTSIAGERAARSVNAAASLGSSLAFTGLVLGLATLLFARRDF